MEAVKPTGIKVSGIGPGIAVDGMADDDHQHCDTFQAVGIVIIQELTEFHYCIRSGRRRLVRSIDCRNSQSSMRAWLPESRTSGTFQPL